MTTMTLSPGEAALVENHRAEQAKMAAAAALYRKVLVQALAFHDWSIERGEGLSYSTFVNTFGYDQPDSRVVYERVKETLAAARGERAVSES